ncbi:hypothetical protein AgCh_002463 [Apium graveolens]
MKCINTYFTYDLNYYIVPERGSLDAKYKLVEATVRAGDLEKQGDSLKKELETQTKRKAVLKSRANRAEKKIQDLNHKLENLQRINDEQKNRILKTERAIQVVECGHGQTGGGHVPITLGYLNYSNDTSPIIELVEEDADGREILWTDNRGLSIRTGLDVALKSAERRSPCLRMSNEPLWL